MSDRVVQRFDKIPEPQQHGARRVWSFPVRVTVEESTNNFLHIGSAGTPLSDIKMQVFKVNGIPMIPATSFKGALRHQLDEVLKANRFSWAQRLRTSEDSLKPCVPSADPSQAEKAALVSQYRVTDRKPYPQHCAVQIEAARIVANAGGICPSCYFLGAAGFPGFARINNFAPQSGHNERPIQQTRLRIDRKTGTAAPGALVTVEQVRPGVAFEGSIEIFEEITGFTFGKCRTIGQQQLDPWLANSQMTPEEAQLFLLNECLFPAVRNITFLGGMKSVGAGAVRTEVLPLA
jgi:CRISPR/Cas system CSM-associated protein Csm3 (group 7 of RAMP superfamily)